MYRALGLHPMPPAPAPTGDRDVAWGWRCFVSLPVITPDLWKQAVHGVQRPAPDMYPGPIVRRRNPLCTGAQWTHDSLVELAASSVHGPITQMRPSMPRLRQA